MTQAYKDGVTKVAQAFGLTYGDLVTSSSLQKKAALPGLVAKILGKTVGVGRRYGELLTGSRAEQLRSKLKLHRKTLDRIYGQDGVYSTLKEGIGRARNGIDVLNYYRLPVFTQRQYLRYGDLLSAANKQIGQSEEKLEKLEDLVNSLTSKEKSTFSAFRKELNRVGDTRLLTLLGLGTGAATGGAKLVRDKVPVAQKKAEEQKQANLLALVKNVPKALQAAKAMRAAGALNAAPPVQLANKGLGQSVLGNLKNLMARSDAADNLTLGRRLMNADLKTLAQAKGRPFPPVKTAPKVPDGSIPALSLKQAPSALPQQVWDHATPQAQQRKARLLEYLKRRFPGYENYGPL